MRLRKTLLPGAATLAALLISPLPASEISSRTVYRCDVGGVITFSDRPCGPDAKEYAPELDRFGTHAAPPATATSAVPAKKRPRSPRRGTSSKSSAQDQAKHAADCERIQESLRDIRARMRRGYGVKEGERLKERQAKLRRRRRARRCR